MSILALKLLSIILILATAIIGGIYPFIRKVVLNRALEFPAAESLAAGVFLGAGLIHMLGDASGDMAQLGFDYPLAFLLAGATFLSLLLIEHISTEIHHKSTGEHSSIFVILAVVMLTVHSFLAGAALGLSREFSVALIILLAILAHKWAASFALSVKINKSTLKLGRGILAFGIFALATPLGIIAGEVVIQHLNQYPIIQPVFNALAAGTFLYLGTLHGLKNSVMIERCCDLKRFSFVIIGFAIMAVVAIWT